MKREKQVDKSHYEFQRYMQKPRWNSLWHQLDEIIKLQPERVLEIGPGPGIFKATASAFGLNIETLDIDPELKPDHVASATEMPFTDGSYDVVCAFQMLEHLPYEKSLRVFKEMVRVARNNVVISLPDAQSTWCYALYIPKVGVKNIMIQDRIRPLKEHKFNGEHYWEINRKNFPVSRIADDFSEYAKLIKSYRVFENAYHRFFLFEK